MQRSSDRLAEKTFMTRLFEFLKQRISLPPDDLLRDAVFRRLWSSILISSLGGQITMLALPLTAAVLLQATPTQMGVLVAVEPFTGVNEYQLSFGKNQPLRAVRIDEKGLSK